MQHIQEHIRTLFVFFCILLIAACSNTTSDDEVGQTYPKDAFDEVQQGLGFRKDHVERQITDHIEAIGDYLGRLDTAKVENQLSEQSLKQYREDLERLKRGLYDLKANVEDGEDQINKSTDQRIRLIEDELMQVKMQIDEKITPEK